MGHSFLAPLAVLAELTLRMLRRDTALLLVKTLSRCALRTLRLDWPALSAAEGERPVVTEAEAAVFAEFPLLSAGHVWVPVSGQQGVTEEKFFGPERRMWRSLDLTG